ncbi:MAG: DNA gyrase inhibitor YacG [Gammaproteobacteria bacterium]|jgi:endogenous inhibitor of DNA gyrase (YacG/DUF329 family)
MSDKPGTIEVACPTCGQKVTWDEQFPFRPFCSERCRLLDLGAWVGGERAIPGEPMPVVDDGGGEDDFGHRG